MTKRLCVDRVVISGNDGKGIHRDWAVIAEGAVMTGNAKSFKNDSALVDRRTSQRVKYAVNHTATHIYIIHCATKDKEQTPIGVIESTLAHCRSAIGS